MGDERRRSEVPEARLVPRTRQNLRGIVGAGDDQTQPMMQRCINAKSGSHETITHTALIDLHRSYQAMEGSRIMEEIIQRTRATINEHPILAKSLALFTVLFLVIAAYVLYCQPYQLQWGATAIEVARFMPGDELHPDPSFLATRAITIEGAPEEIWPWSFVGGRSLTDSTGRHGPRVKFWFPTNASNTTFARGGFPVGATCHFVTL